MEGNVNATFLDAYYEAVEKYPDSLVEMVEETRKVTRSNEDNI